MIETLKEVRKEIETAQRKIDCGTTSSLLAIAITESALAKLDALIAQRESGDDGLAQQYTKLSAHCAMLEDKLATLTNAIGAKQMADFVAKHAAPPAPSISPLTDIDIAAAIEVADAKWADADVPLEWAKHFARAIEAKIGAKP